jgi:hypothetical protein
LIADAQEIPTTAAGTIKIIFSRLNSISCEWRALRHGGDFVNARRHPQPDVVA